MKQQILYILAFRDEPLIKVGLSVDAYMRSITLGPQRFDFKESYLVRSKDQSCIRTLERNLKTFFSAHQVRLEEPMRTGNTETFDSAILPKMPQSIETFRDAFPHAEFQVDRDISALLPPAPKRARQEPKPVSQKATPRIRSLLNELRQWCTQERGR